MALEMFPLPSRNTDRYRMTPTASYRFIYRLMVLNVGLQLLILFLLLAGVVR